MVAEQVQELTPEQLAAAAARRHQQRVRNAADLVRLDQLTTRAIDRRNKLWAEGMAAGDAAAECGEPYGLTAQAVRWNLKQIAEGHAPKARTGSKRGLKSGSRPRSTGAG